MDRLTREGDQIIESVFNTDPVGHQPNKLILPIGVLFITTSFGWLPKSWTTSSPFNPSPVFLLTFFANSRLRGVLLFLYNFNGLKVKGVPSLSFAVHLWKQCATSVLLFDPIIFRDRAWFAIYSRRFLSRQMAFCIVIPSNQLNCGYYTYSN